MMITMHDYQTGTKDKTDCLFHKFIRWQEHSTEK